ncbi:zinc-binding dehydrogenase, partial [Falsirhodobacter sp. 1013]|uniref:zinc-binding dehydrogenase n=1 Tax=Falsirhodobacter sp. 1013 TaxID=3417566 RepID=UPI003EB8E174
KPTSPQSRWPQPSCFGCDQERVLTLGKVVASRNDAYPEGATVRALGGWAEHVILPPDALSLEQIDAKPDLAPELHMGLLGSSGLTAWIGMHEIAGIRPGDTVLVSAATGSVGSVAGQIAKRHGCTVIGLAGGPEKRRTLATLGYDHAIDYRAVPDLGAALGRIAPNGIDVFFDNVGGEMLETVMMCMADRGRIAVCGMMGQYNNQDNAHANRSLWQLVVKRLMLRGFLTPDHADRLPEAARDLAAGAKEGSLVPLQQLYDGLGEAPRAFIDLMSGKTTGKTLVRL